MGERRPPRAPVDLESRPAAVARSRRVQVQRRVRFLYSALESPLLNIGGESERAV